MNTPPPGPGILERLLGSLPVSMIAVDLDDTVVAWNAHAERLYGWAAAEAIGRSLMELVVPADGVVAAAKVLEQLRQGQPWEGEFQVRRRDGQVVTVHVIDTPISDAHGVVTGFLGLAVDVTEQRRAPMAVLEAVINNSLTSVTVIGADDRISMIVGDSRRAAATPGRARRAVGDLIHEASYQSLLRRIRAGETVRLLAQSDGRDYDATGVALPDAVVGPGGVAVVATDITDRLRETRRFQALIENTEDVTSIVGEDGAVQYVSPSAARLLGWTPGDAEEHTGRNSIHPEDLATATASFQAALAQPGVLIRHEYRMQHHDGRWLNLEQTLVNCLADPAIRGVVCVAHDVTARVAVQRRLLALNRLHAVLSEAGNTMVRATDPLQLLADTCRILVERGSFAAAVVSTAPGSGGGLTLAEWRRPAGVGNAAVAHPRRGGATRAGDRASHRPARARRGTKQPAMNCPDELRLPVERRDGQPAVLVLTLEPGAPPVSDDERQLLTGLVRDLAFALDSLSLDRHRAEAMQLGAKRARQQSIVSRLGFIALGIGDVGEIFDSVVAALAPLGLRQVAVLELLPDGDRMLVRAVSGEREPLARGNVIAASLLPLAHGILASGLPLMIDDFSRDPRFDGSPIVSSGSGLGVPIRVNGQTVAVLTVASVTPDAFDGQDLDFYDSVAHVISGAMERARYENSLRHDAMHDQLTGLPNRILLQDRLTQALSRAQRRQAGPVGVLVGDLDAFKLVNDSLGHDAGDRLLTLVGERIREATRPSDTIARLGGDEFVVLCEDLSDGSEAAAVARRITERLQPAFLLDGREVSLTISTGVAVGGDGATAEELLRDAEVAMYRAKETGRGRYELFDDALRNRLVHLVAIEQGLRHALERKQFVVAYQPVVDLTSGEVHEAEALLRWTLEDGTPVSPAEFIPIAEDTGMIIAIGAWVLTRACQDAVLWNERMPGASLGVAVNLSARQIADPDLVRSVVRALETTGLPAHLLRLEITETALMEEGSGGTDTLHALDELGVRLSVDDFGTGYSSLMYLRRYPVRVLKVDRYFVAGLGKNPEDEAIVAAVIALAHSLGLTATAEGVETVQQLTRLRSLHCDCGQGYLWSRAVPIDDFIPLMEAMRDYRADPVDEPPAPLPELDGPARPAQRPRSVVLADDSPSDRGLLRLALEASGDFTVVGEAADGPAAIALARATRPNLLILDMAMPGMNGLEALGPIHQASPATLVVFLSGFLAGALADAVTQAGAFAQFDKSLPIPSLVRRLSAVLVDNPRLAVTA